MSRKLGASVAALTAGVLVLSTFAHAYPRPGRTERVSVGIGGSEADSHSFDPSASADGRFVAFWSLASNLVPGDTNGAWDVFVHARETGTTELVSVRSDGAQGDDNSYLPSISSDGRFVVFQSQASDLVPGDTNGTWDVFVHDRGTGETERVSLASDGEQGNGISGEPYLTANGRYIAFASYASNLVEGDGNGAADVFLHDRLTGATELVSVGTDGSQGNGNAVDPSVSADGRFVVFIATASNLVPEDTNRLSDVFIHDRETRATERVSVGSAGTQGNDSSNSPSLSIDGRYVAFHSMASNLVPGKNANGLASDVFLHDRLTGMTELLSVVDDGGTGNNQSLTPQIAAGGRYVTFSSFASDLIPGDTKTADVFVRDRGQPVGIGSLAALPTTDGITASGWATYSGAVVSSVIDAADDGAPGRELTGGSLTFRPELEDLLVRLRLASLSSERCTIEDPVEVCERGGGAPGALAPGRLHRRILHGVGFELEGASYEVRARTGSKFRAASETFSDPPHFALFRCDPSCTEQASLSGGIGTTGAEVWVSVPLSALSAAEGLALTRVRAFLSSEAEEGEAQETIDEADLPDATIPVSRVELGIAEASTPEEEVVFTVTADLLAGDFSGTIPTAGLPSGSYRVWARACLGDVCGPATFEEVVL